MPARLTLPPEFLAYAGRSPEWAIFLDRLPALVRDLMGEWQLTSDGEPTHGFAAVVVPVRTSSGRPAALKVGWPHEEAEHEHLALQHWHGHGAVQLLRADPRRFALLLERLHREDQCGVPDRRRAVGGQLPVVQHGSGQRGSHRSIPPDPEITCRSGKL